MKYLDLYTIAKDTERRIAYGSESALWGDFLNRMHEIGAPDMHPEPDDSFEVTQDEADWWIDAYEAEELFFDHEDDLSEDAKERITDVSDDWESRFATIREEVTNL